ncbi:MAG: DUF1059 domain-containing protein [Nitrospirae bacterium]|nr:DUF1059 domain-containing protein [Nitrospirota bacterium]
MATKPYKQLGCLDVNRQGDCAFQVRAETEEEILRLGAEHAKHCHSKKTLPSDMAHEYERDQDGDGQRLAGCGKTYFVVRQAHHERENSLLFSTPSVRPEAFEG